MQIKIMFYVNFLSSSSTDLFSILILYFFIYFSFWSSAPLCLFRRTFAISARSPNVNVFTVYPHKQTIAHVPARLYKILNGN